MTIKTFYLIGYRVRSCHGSSHNPETILTLIRSNTPTSTGTGFCKNKRWKHCGASVKKYLILYLSIRTFHLKHDQMAAKSKARSNQEEDKRGACLEHRFEGALKVSYGKFGDMYECRNKS